MGDAISLGLGQPKLEKSARHAIAEDYVGCGKYFGRDVETSLLRGSKNSNFTGRTKTIADGETIVPSGEYFKGSQHAIQAAPQSGFRQLRHQSRAASNILKESKDHSAGRGSQLRGSKGFLPYSEAVIQEVRLSQHHPPSVMLQMPNNAVHGVSRISRRTAVQTNNPDQESQSSSSESVLEVINPQAPTHPNRLSKASIRSSYIRNQLHQVKAVNDRAAALEEKYNIIMDSYEGHQIDAAHQHIQEFYEQFNTQFEKHPQHRQRKAQLDSIETQYQDVIKYSAFFDLPTWELRDEIRGIKISLDSSGDTIGVLIESELNVPIETFAAVMIEVDLHKKWIPFVVESKLEKQIDRNSIIGHVVNDFPMISKREAFFQGTGYDRLNFNDTIFIFSRSIHSRPDLLELYDYKPMPKKNSVMLDYKYLCMEYRPITPKKGYLRMCVNIDMRLNIVPKFIMEMATKKFGVDMFESMVKISKKFRGSEWERAVQSHPEGFLFFQDIVQDYYRRKGITN